MPHEVLKSTSNRMSIFFMHLFIAHIITYSRVKLGVKVTFMIHLNLKDSQELDFELKAAQNVTVLLDV